MIPKGDSDEQARREAADPRLNVALEASAGTGKTRVLVDRYVRLVEEGARPHHILAITFTRKAAGEMKNRILEELRRRPDLWHEIRDRLFDIHVATIDAFCLGLLKEFPLEAGLDPDVDLLDEVDVRRLSEVAIAEVLSESLQGESASPSSARAPSSLGFLIGRFGEAAIERGLRDFLRSRLVKSDVLARFVHRFVPRDLQPDRILLEAARGLGDALGGEEGIRNLLACGPGESVPSWKPVAFALSRIADPERVSAVDVGQIARYFLTQLSEPRKRPPPFLKKSVFPDVGHYREHVDRLLEAAPQIAEVYGRWVRGLDLYAVRELWKLYRAGERRFAALKKIQGGLDFTDVLTRAVDLLERRGEFSQSRFRLESRYHHLLIDEFQDTNEVQWRLVRALIDSWGEGAGLVQEVILEEQARGRGRGLLREPSIFIVGDRKQSIYGWRDARVEVMETAARHVVGLRARGGRRLTIRRSFRGKGILLDFLNDVFAEMPKAGEDLDWAFRYRDSDHFPPTESEGDEAPVAIAVSEDLPSAAAAISDEVVRLMQEEGLRPRDVAILFRSRTHYRIYEDALIERGVPAYVYRGLGFFDSPEVRDVQALIRYLAEPASELRAAELLRSRWISLSDTGLALLAASRGRRRSGAGEGPLARWLRGSASEEALPTTFSASDRDAALRAASSVPRWVAQVDRLQPVDLLHTILDATDYAGWFAQPKGPQGWENLKKVLELIRRAQNRGYLTMSRLADYLESASAGDESAAVLEAIDAVNLMTIHAAKGLEFPAVFVVNLEQKTRTDTSLPRIRERADGEVEIHALGVGKSEGPDRATEEEKRLLYVALTRAKSRLVLSASRLAEGESRNSLLSLLPESLRELFEQASKTERHALDWRPRSTRHRLRVLRPSVEPRHYRREDVSPSVELALERLEAGSSTRVTVSELVTPLSPPPRQRTSENTTELAVGHVVHRLLEYDLAQDEELEAAATTLVPPLAPWTTSDRETVARRASVVYRQLRSRPELERLLGSGSVHRELPVSLRRGSTIVRGVIDALVVSHQRAVVLDYKTGAPRPEHRAQMEIYLEGAAALFPAHELEGWIFYPTSDPQQVHPSSPAPKPPSQLRLFEK